MKKLWIVIALFGGFAQSDMASDVAHAADQEGRYLLIGIGNDTCTQWATARRIETPKVVKMESWLLGYLTATNVWRANTGDVTAGMESDQIFKWMDGYCKDHPKKRVGEAARNLVFGLDELLKPNKKGK